MKRSILLFGTYLLALSGYVIDRDVPPFDKQVFKMDTIVESNDIADQNLTGKTQGLSKKVKEDIYNISEDN
ncbi:hypothetical protein H4O18_16905 [Arenibacter sp. BSSL-BM3]|uniref:Uncharacterized protein n=1 Tax=Arenibacter arenosicollis TaxID=2762274 RepID=A0ABR7QR55_9FLAO|nr:hypothetical protein [Arenibacter arenosicollis]MBC8769681.1 hypothetical protein [Arenibacter arenosicollis]